MTVHKWSQTAASNDTADSTINLRENQAPSTYNNAVRALMAAVRKWWDDLSGNIVTGGSSTAYTFTSGQGLTALTDGFHFRARMHATSGTNPTMAVDGLTAKQIRSVYGTNVPLGALVFNGIHGFTYDATDDAYIVEGVAAGIPIGAIADFAGATAPALWLLCFGQAVSRTTYAALFAVLGTTYGAGDGSTTFNVPDCRGRVTAGQDDMGGVSANRLTNQSGGLDGDTLGAAGGAETHVLQTSEIPSHTHTGTTGSSGAHTHTTDFEVREDFFPSGAVFGLRPSQTPIEFTATTSSNGAHTHPFTSDATGGGGAHNNVQPTLILNKIIFAGA